MGKTKSILVTGATEKVGRAFIDRFLDDPAFDAFTVRALREAHQELVFL